MYLKLKIHFFFNTDEIYSESMLTSMSCAGITITKTANSVETINTNEVAKTQFYIYENEQHKNRYEIMIKTYFQINANLFCFNFPKIHILFN